MKIIHLTDLHVTPKGVELFGQEPAKLFDWAVKDIVNNHSDAACCVISGDLTHRAEPEAYEVLKQSLEPLPMPVHMIIGNHDLRLPATQVLGLETDPNGFVQTAVDTDFGTFLFLDTVVENSNEGAYCKQRLDWLRETLSQKSGRPIWVVMHHSPFPLGMPAMDQIQLSPHDCTAIEGAFSGHDIRHIFFGHYHRPVSGIWRGIPFTSHRSMMLQCALDLKTKDEVRGIHEEPQYAVCLIEDGLTRVHYHDFASHAATISMGHPSE